MNAMTRSGLTLGLCTFVAVATLTLANALTRDRIEHTRHQWLLNNIESILPQGPFDHNALQSAHWITAKELGSQEPVQIYPVYRDQQPLAAVLSVTAPDGYSGDIKLLLGVTAAGEIIGARVSEHHETPGLGDDIDYQRSNWIQSFRGKFLSESTAGSWAVKKEGGRYDAFTGATITPRAVINAIHRALRWYEQHHEQVYSP